MLEVKVILHDANTGVVSELANVMIINDGTGTESEGNYDVQAWEQPRLTRGRLVFEGRVEGHDRAWPVLRLVRKALQEINR